MLQEEGTLENQRGIGYFTAKDARALVLKQRREKFIKRELPQLFSTMETLGITLEDLQHYAHNEEIPHEVQAKEE